MTMSKIESSLNLDMSLGPLFEHPCFSRLRVRMDAAQRVDLADIPAAAQAFVAAGLGHNQPGPKLITVKSVKLQEELANDLEVWGVPFLFYPQTEPVAEGALPDQEMAGERLALPDQLRPNLNRPVLAPPLAT